MKIEKINNELKEHIKGNNMVKYTSIGACANLCMLCTACFLMLKHWFYWKYQYSLLLLTIYIFIPVSGCVGRGPSALHCPRA
jgi:hypothetical protein